MLAKPRLPRQGFSKTGSAACRAGSASACCDAPQSAPASPHAGDGLGACGPGEGISRAATSRLRLVAVPEQQRRSGRPLGRPKKRELLHVNVVLFESNLALGHAALRCGPVRFDLGDFVG